MQQKHKPSPAITPKGMEVPAPPAKSVCKGPKLMDEELVRQLSGPFGRGREKNPTRNIPGRSNVLPKKENAQEQRGGGVL